jgi:hypothetical protein
MDRHAPLLTSSAGRLSTSIVREGAEANFLCGKLT